MLFRSMNENNQALTSITFNEDGHEKTIDIKNVNWAFEKGGMLYVVENDKKIYTFELSGKDAEDIYESLKKANPDMIVGALMGKRIGFEKLANTRDLCASTQPCPIPPPLPAVPPTGGIFLRNERAGI